MKSEIFYMCTDQTATLFWDKPLEAAAQARYKIIIDQSEVFFTDKTHYTIENLAPRSSHNFAVYLTNSSHNTHASNHCDNFRENCIGSDTFRTSSPKEKLDVTAAPYFAKGDGVFMNTAILQRAIDDCGPQQYVYIPSGTFMTGSLYLHSNMELYLEKDAILQGTADYHDYEPRIKSRFEGTEMLCYSSLLNLGQLDHTAGYNCRNVLIHGHGTIASGGRILAQRIIEHETELLKDYLAANEELVASCENSHTIPGRVRPRLINISNCQNVRISGLTLENGASWNVHMIYSDHIITDHCTFKSDGVWNGDGWDPDSSSNCTLFASKFYTGDDSVAIKSGKNPEGNLIARPTKHIRVFDCYSDFGHGICIGSEMSGGIEDVRIWDCNLKRAFSGIECKATKKRGGYIRDIMVRDCTAPRVMLHAVSYNDDGIAAPVPPVIENCHFENLELTCMALDHDGNWHNVVPMELAGFDVPGHELHNITFRRISISSKEAQSINLQYCKNITFEEISVLT